jgi:DNA-binding NarL/FixJ family response regulator
MIKVLIVDDEVLLLKLLERQFKTYEDIFVVGVATDGYEAVELVKQLSPDVVIMDICMPICGGLEASKQIKEMNLEIKILMLTDSIDEEDICKALNIPIEGYLLKSIDTKELVLAIRSIYAGVDVFHSFIKGVDEKNIFNHTQDSKKEKHIIIGGIPVLIMEKELQIIQLIVEGYSTTDMAIALDISEETLRNEISNIISKLKLTDRTQVAFFAIRHNLVKEVLD